MSSAPTIVKQAQVGPRDTQVTLTCRCSLAAHMISSRKNAVLSLQAKAMDFIDGQWQGLQKAPQGSIKNYAYRCAGQRCTAASRIATARPRAVSPRSPPPIRSALLKLLEQVTPEEKFLRQIPNSATTCDVIFPSSLPEKLVRRRLHMLATECTEGHRRWLFWSYAALPFTAATVVRVSPSAAA